MGAPDLVTHDKLMHGCAQPNNESVLEKHEDSQVEKFCADDLTKDHGPSYGEACALILLYASVEKMCLWTPQELMSYLSVAAHG